MDLMITSYDVEYKEHCLNLFDLNTPKFFAVNERIDFIEFLEKADGRYSVVLSADELVGCFGLSETECSQQRQISWVMVDPRRHGHGLGRFMMESILKMSSELAIRELLIAASHVSEPFFARFGAERITYKENGWGNAMHRVDMRLHITRTVVGEA